MAQKTEEDILKDFKDFFIYPGWNNLKQSLMSFGFEIGPGWFNLLYELCAKIKPLVDVYNKESDADYQFRFVQIKEKYCGACFYCGSATDEILDIISEYEDKSYKICEECGQSGCLKSNYGWYKTLCNKCAAKQDYKDLPELYPETNA